MGSTHWQAVSHPLEGTRGGLSGRRGFSGSGREQRAAVDSSSIFDRPRRNADGRSFRTPQLSKRSSNGEGRGFQRIGLDLSPAGGWFKAGARLLVPLHG